MSQFTFSHSKNPVLESNTFTTFPQTSFLDAKENAKKAVDAFLNGEYFCTESKNISASSGYYGFRTLSIRGETFASLNTSTNAILVYGAGSYANPFSTEILKELKKVVAPVKVDRAKVMRRAWEIAKANELKWGNKYFSQSLKQAWAELR